MSMACLRDARLGNLGLTCTEDCDILAEGFLEPTGAVGSVQLTKLVRWLVSEGCAEPVEERDFDCRSHLQHVHFTGILR